MACATAACPKPEIDTRVQEAARILELGAMLERKPRQLSGGQRQRVAMGRAIVRQPKVFLFDEPLSNLDAKLRIAMRVEIRKLQRRLKTTSIYVTHDQLEAMTLADMLVVMNGGQVEQIGNPLDIYQKPATTFVASFIGAPPMNLLPLRSDDIKAQLGRRRNARGRHSGNPARGFRGFERRHRRHRASTSPWRRSSASAPKPSSTVRPQREGEGVAANPGELPPGEVIVRIPGAVAPGIGRAHPGGRAARKAASVQRRRPQAGSTTEPVIPGCEANRESAPSGSTLRVAPE